MFSLKGLDLNTDTNFTKFNEKFCAIKYILNSFINLSTQELALGLTKICFSVSGSDNMIPIFRFRHTDFQDTLRMIRFQNADPEGHRMKGNG